MRFQRSVHIGAPPEEVYAWHARPGAFERLVPPWERVRLLSRTGSIADGDEAQLEMRLGPLPLRWRARHRDHVPGRQFADEQVGGPFARWRHTHRFLPAEAGTRLEDDIEYAPPLGPLGALADAVFIRRTMARMFAYRHAVTRGDIETQRRYAGPAMRIAITGASGLVGSHLGPFLTTAGHDVLRLVRRGTGEAGSDEAGTAAWDPATGRIDSNVLGEIDAVVHLAGVGIADKRWTEAHKRDIRDSRVGPTAALCRTLAALPRKPSVLVCASAIGYYGDRGAEALTEQSAAGTGFLPEVCVEWERAADAARDAGIRVVHARLGIVLSSKGGALAQMLTPFQLGAGGRLGSGRQYMSWVGLDDVLGAVYHAMRRAEIAGPMNVTGPAPVTNEEFTATLARVLRRPALVPVPAFALRALFGEMAGPLLLEGQRVLPRVLEGSGYGFRHTSLEGALRHALGR